MRLHQVQGNAFEDLSRQFKVPVTQSRWPYPVAFPLGPPATDGIISAVAYHEAKKAGESLQKG
jgi:hypothetical protein